MRRWCSGVHRSALGRLALVTRVEAVDVDLARRRGRDDAIARTRLVPSEWRAIQARGRWGSSQATKQVSTRRKLFIALPRGKQGRENVESCKAEGMRPVGVSRG
ncbi:hypothetical protein C8R45DRAFT_1041347 [Mycena sanguinolenta]|nr:hypothetical protein C8R45DRAFT_1041347 [Mycena sanguinolenta]